MTDTVQKFHAVKHTERRTGTCPVCKRKVTRSKTFENTINPFNKTAEGTPKTYAAVLADVRQLGREWQPDFRHEACMS